MKLLIIPFILLIITAAACANSSSDSAPPQLTYVTVTPAPEINNTPAIATVTPGLPTDLSIYHQAMKPAFNDDIEDTAAKGITRYHIDAQIDPDSLTPPNLPKISASMTVRYTNQETVLLNQVYFRLFPNTTSYGGTMAVSNVRVNGDLARISFTSDETALFIPFPRALEPGDDVEISMDYEATVPLGANAYNGLYAYGHNILSLAGFYPTIPVFDHNGWHLDIPPTFADATHTDVALYEVLLTVPDDMVVATTGTVVKTVFREDGVQIIHVVSGPMRDFFVTMSSEYQYLSQDVDGLIVNSYFPVGYDEAGAFALDVASAALEIYSDMFGPYPYQEFDVATVPITGTLGGVEYPGIVAMADRYYASTHEADRLFMEFVVAHEVAHQWWYGLVGSDQVTHPWLDEALTQYTTIHYFEQRYGAVKAAEMSAIMFSSQYPGASRPVAGSVHSFNKDQYFPVVYSKGPLFFAAVRTQMGDEAYFTSLRQYAEKYRYGVATPGNLINTFANASDQNIEALYEEWILKE